MLIFEKEEVIFLTSSFYFLKLIFKTFAYNLLFL
jgi:hypothetical protein